MRSNTIDEINRRIADTHGERNRTRTLVAAGRWRAADDDATRCVAFDARVKRDSGMAEAVVGTNDFQPVAFLAEGATASRAVARVAVETPQASLSGTGFLISPELFITNQHVIQDAGAAAQTTIVFDDELDEQGQPKPRTVYRLAPDQCAVFSDENELDYAVVALGNRVDGQATVEALGCCALSFTPDRHRKGMNVNIVQHPEGMPKTIAIRNNLLTGRTDTRLLYETDTDFGSSGSPVYNDQWEVIALHHYGAAQAPAEEVHAAVPSATAADARAAQVNEGIRISSIYQDLEARLPRLPAAARERVQRALALWTAPTPAAGKQLERRPPLLRQLPEGARLDTDYDNRNGFDAAFVPGLKLDMGKIAAPRKSVIAPLNKGAAAGTPGELRYQNFSVIMHKARRFALLTATNIDGATHVTIDRGTGQPAVEQPEGDTWFNDMRISDSYCVGQGFYSGWSHLFDRGHLTRREDPNWGPYAMRANADTFHFTNCTPQHWKFNESLQYWQGIERYVLEKGIFESGGDKHVTVLQGPVFDDTNDLWADDVQVPSAFWKVVAWNGESGLKAVALMANQAPLFSQTRHGGGEPPPKNTPVDVLQWRTSIPALAQKTSLDFSPLKPYDTAKDELPVVGEALMPIRRWEDIPLE